MTVAIGAQDTGRRPNSSVSRAASRCPQRHDPHHRRYHVAPGQAERNAQLIQAGVDRASDGPPALGARLLGAYAGVPLG
jgi:hypothetical protein